MFPLMRCLSYATKQHYMVLPFRFLGGGEGVKVEFFRIFLELRKQ